LDKVKELVGASAEEFKKSAKLGGKPEINSDDVTAETKGAAAKIPKSARGPNEKPDGTRKPPTEE